MGRKPHCYEFPRPAVTVDAVLFRVRGRSLEVLLVKRKHAPFAGRWALPGGFIGMHETLVESLRRELREETGVRGATFLAQLGAFGDPGRDPRGRTVTVAFVGLVRGTGARPKGSDDAAEAAWHPVAQAPLLAFDHGAIVTHALRWLKAAGRFSPVLFSLLKNHFTAADLGAMLFAVYGKTVAPAPYAGRYLRAGPLRRGKNGCGYIYVGLGSGKKR